MSNPNKDINLLVTKPKDIEKIITGEKTAVRRNDRYANVGDTLELKGIKFVIKAIYQQKLRDVTEENAKEEGYQNLDDYKEGLTSIHRGAVWNPEYEVWVHELVPV